MAKKIKWTDGDVFAIPLMDNSFSIGQVLDSQMENVVRIALYDEKINSLENINLLSLCKEPNLISLLASTREQLDYGFWKIIGNKEVTVSKIDFPNQQYRIANWIGAVIYDAVVLEDFLNSFYSFLPWDDWFNTDFLDEFLIDVSKKPKTLLFKKKQ